ncbi:MAG: diguanylate cyclase [Marinobacter sp.]|nr:diguanylate cyclase [Marinobacter sp.]
MAGGADQKPFRSINRTLLQQVIVTGIIAILLVALLQAYWAYRAEMNQSRHLQATLSQSYIPLLGLALQQSDDAGVRQQLNNMVAFPDIAGVTLSAAQKPPLSAGLPGHSADASLPVTASAVAGEPLGDLSVYFDWGVISDRIIARAMENVLVFSVFVLLFCLVIYRSLQHRLRRPLQQIVRYSQQLSPRQYAEPLVIDRPERAGTDEIDLVLQGFGKLREGIDHYVLERDLAMDALARERDQLDARVRERTEEIRRINNYLEMLSRLSMSMVDLEPARQPVAMHEALEELAIKVDARGCGIAAFSEDGGWRWRFVWRAPGVDSVFRDDGELTGLTRQRGWAVEENKTLPETILCTHQNEHHGYVLAFYDASRKLNAAVERRLLQMTSEVFFKLIERWRNQRELENSRRELFHLSRTDHLTGLANRRYFDEAKLIEGRRAQRSGGPVSVLMIDVDFFKAYNDLYGHGRGDDCLIQLAAILGHYCRRAGELPARLGGEEFAILLPEHDIDSARDVAERVRCAIAELGITHEGSPMNYVTVSIGCATWSGDQGATPVPAIFESLMADADRRLYEAKNAGRNRVAAEPVRESVQTPSN